MPSRDARATHRKPAPTRTVSLPEAAYVTRLPLKAVNAAIDRREIIARAATAGAGRRTRGAASRARRLGLPELIYLAVRPTVAGVLSRTARKQLYQKLRAIAAQIPTDASSRDLSAQLSEIELGGVRVMIGDAVERVTTGLDEIEASEQLVLSDPQIRSGEPVLRGTRVPVYLLADLSQQGAPAEEILGDYPSVTCVALQAALVYAATHPRRGRPRRAPWRAAAVHAA